MALTSRDVQKIAMLARIKLTGQESDLIEAKLNQLLAWVEQLQEVNTDGVAPMSGVGSHTLPMRKDAVTDGNLKEAVLKNAPKQAFDCFVVPKVVE